MTVMTTVELRRESFGAGAVFSRFYTESLFTDIKLAAAGDPTLTIKAHRVVLSAASPYLARKIRSYKDDEGPLVLPYIGFNLLKQILDYLYHGRVTIRAEEVEDFHSFRRMFEVQLGPVDGTRAGEEEAQSGSQVQNARKRSLLLRGDGPIALKKERLEVNRLRGVGATRGPSPISASPSPAAVAPPLKREPPMPPVIGPVAAAAATNTSFSITFGETGSRGLSRPGGGTGTATNDNKSDDDSAVPADKRPLAIPTNILSRAPNRSNFSGPHDKPVAGPRGYFWVEIINQVDTTEHAIRDKYCPVHFLGSFGQYKSLYLAYPDAAKVEHVIRTVKAVEKYLPMKPVAELPSQFLVEFGSLRENPAVAASLPSLSSGVRSSASNVGTSCLLVPHSSRPREKYKYVRIRNFPWKKVNLLRLLRSNGLDELKADDIFGEPGTGEYRVRLPTMIALEQTVTRVNGQNHLGNTIIAEPCDGII